MLIDLCGDNTKENIQSAHWDGGEKIKIGLGFDIIRL